MSEENKAIARRIYEELWNRQKPEAIEEIFAANVVHYNLPPGFLSGIEGIKTHFKMFNAAFPDTKMNVDDQISEGDRVVTRRSGRGTHSKEFLGIAATGRSVTVHGIDMNRISEGGSLDALLPFLTSGPVNSLHRERSPRN